MAGHYHHNDAGLTQNQGNHVGDRPCVRQSRTYRQHNGGNTMKDIMGQGNLNWDTNNMQGAYAGAAHPGNNDGGQQVHGQQYQQGGGAPPPPQQQQQQQAPQGQYQDDQYAQQAPPPQQYQQQQAPPQQQQQQQPEAHWSHHQEQPSQARAPQQQQQAHWSHHAEAQPAQASANRGRPGAGAANKTTYNFMTGQ